MRMILRGRLTTAFGTSVVALFFLIHAAYAGVSYTDPTGGWLYTFDGTLSPAIDGLPTGFGDGSKNDGLDGTWQHNQGGRWDGTAPGDPLSDPSAPVSIPDTSTSAGGPVGTSPGGLGEFTDGSTSYIRLQDAGAPEDHGWCQPGQTGSGGCGPTVPNVPPGNTNRRVYFGHNMAVHDGVTDELVMTGGTGITVSFRARIPNSGPLDDIYFPFGAPGEFETDADFNNSFEVEGKDFLIWQRNYSDAPIFPAPFNVEGNANGDNDINGLDLAEWEKQFGNGALGTKPWFEDAPNGRGYVMDNNRGMINIVQNNTVDDTDTLVGLSLVTSTDVADTCAAVASSTLCSATPGKGGLIMNNLNGTYNPNTLDIKIPIDSITGGGSLNMLDMDDADLNNWTEFWVTLEDNGSGTEGNILVTVYTNGSTTAAGSYNVTLAGDGDSLYKEDNDPYIEFGLGNTGPFGSLDLDFLSYKIGATPPVAALSAGVGAVPEPTSLVLVAMGLMGLCGVRRSRVR